MIDQEKAITVLSDNVCRTCSKNFDTGVSCPSCRDHLQSQATIFDGSRLEGLSPEILEALDRLEKYEFPAGLIARLVEKPPYDTMTAEQIQTRLKEFKKFMALIAINFKSGKRVEMVSEEIDDIWHALILFTREYQEFCRMLVGEYIHHVPNIKSDDLSAIRNYPKQEAKDFSSDYERYFGELDPVWRADLVAANRKEQDDDKMRKKRRIAFAVLLAMNATLVLFLVKELATAGYAAASTYTASAYLPLLVGGTVWSRLSKDPYNKRMVAMVVMITFAALLGTAVIFGIQCRIDNAMRTGVIVAFSIIFVAAAALFAGLREKRPVKKGIKSSAGAGCGAAVGVACSGGGGGCGGGGCGGGC